MLNKHRQEAQAAYSQFVSWYGETLGSNGTDNEQVQSRRDSIAFLLMQFLCQCFPNDRFQFAEFPSIILSTVAANVFRPDKAPAAFLHIEQYLLLLCLMPWKQEYRTIKKFGGYYQSKIESHLRNVESIFKLVGFQDNNYGSLDLSGIPDTRRFEDVAFECFVASVECTIVSKVCVQDVNRGITPFKVVEVRSQNSGTAEEIFSLIEKQQSKTVNSNVIDGAIVRPTGKGKERMDQSFRNKLEGYMRTAKEHSSGDTLDIPYIDEDEKKDSEFSEGTLDYHLLASLQIVGDKEVKPAKPVDPVQCNTGGSQEWSFVREGLERKHGKKYFDGPRKDILMEDEAQADNQLYPAAGSRPQLMAAVVRPNLSPCAQTTMDSAYDSQSSTYPPSVSLHQVVPTVRHSDVVIRKNPGVTNEVKPNFSQTVPLLRRLPTRGLLDEASCTYPAVSSAPVSVYSPATVPRDMDNIKAYQKNMSAPASTGEIKLSINNVEQQPFPSNTSRIKTRSTGYSSGRISSAVDGCIINNSTINKPVTQNIPISSGVSIAAAWSCQHCTYINIPDSIVCDVCSKTRDGQLEMDSPTVGNVSKVCGACTLENKTGSLVCHACGSELAKVHTTV